MTARWMRFALAAACLSAAAPSLAQTVVGAASADGRYNRLRSLSARAAPAVATRGPDAFGTVAVGAGVTFYDARFRRVAAADRNHPRVVALASSLRGLAPMEQLSRVQAEVSRKVSWAHDLDTVRVADLWANAGETLDRGRGDSEDIAIVKMQALKLAGFNPRDLYISIGRHRTAGAHIVLLARTPQGMMVLDDKASTPRSAALHDAFTPILTLGEGKSWVHGRRVQGGSVRSAAR